MKIGDEVYVHGYIDEIRNDVIIIRNKGGYFGTEQEEVFPSAQPTRKTGKWIDGQNMPGYPRIPYRIGEKYCSECQNEAMRDGDDEQQLTEFCPNCGSYNGGEQDDGCMGL